MPVQTVYIFNTELDDELDQIVHELLFRFGDLRIDREDVGHRGESRQSRGDLGPHGCSAFGKAKETIRRGGHGVGDCPLVSAEAIRSAGEFPARS